MTSRYSTLDEVPIYESINTTNYLAVEVWNSGSSFQTLSYKYYGTTKLWWAIAHANKVVDPFNHPYVGWKLIIPRRIDIPGES
jgi:hypothetical protein